MTSDMADAIERELGLATCSGESCAYIRAYIVRSSVPKAAFPMPAADFLPYLLCRERDLNP